MLSYMAQPHAVIHGSIPWEAQPTHSTTCAVLQQHGLACEDAKAAQALPDDLMKPVKAWQLMTEQCMVQLMTEHTVQLAGHATLSNLPPGA